MRYLGTLAPILGALLALPACGGCENDEGMANEVQRLWGRDKIAAEVQAKADQDIDANALDARPDTKSHVLNMSFEETVARLGFLQYKGKATFKVGRNKHKLSVVEETLVEHGLHGSFRVLQKDEDGSVTRETVYTNGVYYVRNGPGQLRVQGTRLADQMATTKEAFEPLSTFTRYYGPRLGLAKVGPANVKGRSAIKYDFVLLEGSELVEVAGMKGKKKPTKLKGALYVDEATGAPIKAKIDGTLMIPPPKEVGKWGQLTLHLDFEIQTTEGLEIKPGEFIATIKRHPVDLEPTGFLKGGTRTSTVIGGKKK